MLDATGDETGVWHAYSFMFPVRLLSSVRFLSYFSLHILSTGDCIPVGVDKYRYNPGISLNLKSRSRGKKGHLN